MRRRGGAHSRGAECVLRLGVAVVGRTPTEFHELEPGEKLTLNPTAKVEKPFTFKWLKKYEVKCSGAKYNGLYLEGTASLGAKVITFEAARPRSRNTPRLWAGRSKPPNCMEKWKAQLPTSNST